MNILVYLIIASALAFVVIATISVLSLMMQVASEDNAERASIIKTTLYSLSATTVVTVITISAILFVC